MGQEKFDYLVNNAGTALQAPFALTTEEQMDSMYYIHFKGVFLLSQRLLPLMNDGGKIVNVSSGVTRITFPGLSVYAAMKGAVEVLTRYMAKELGSRRITVNVVAPGAVETDFGGGYVRDNAEVNQYVASTTALGRAGVADDIGPMVALAWRQECPGGPYPRSSSS
jgi:NAD(P)-dependent dehydrogenase (short-subunit alcohol dehydrogenase family)